MPLKTKKKLQQHLLLLPLQSPRLLLLPPLNQKFSLLTSLSWNLLRLLHPFLHLFLPWQRITSFAKPKRKRVTFSILAEVYFRHVILIWSGFDSHPSLVRTHSSCPIRPVSRASGLRRRNR